MNDRYVHVWVTDEERERHATLKSMKCWTDEFIDIDSRLAREATWNSMRLPVNY